MRSGCRATLFIAKIDASRPSYWWRVKKPWQSPKYKNTCHPFRHVALPTHKQLVEKGCQEPEQAWSEKFKIFIIKSNFYMEFHNKLQCLKILLKNHFVKFLKLVKKNSRFDMATYVNYKSTWSLLFNTNLPRIFWEYKVPNLKITFWSLVNFLFLGIWRFTFRSSG